MIFWRLSANYEDIWKTSCAVLFKFGMRVNSKANLIHKTFFTDPPVRSSARPSISAKQFLFTTTCSIQYNLKAWNLIRLLSSWTGNLKFLFGSVTPFFCKNVPKQILVIERWGWETWIWVNRLFICRNEQTKGSVGSVCSAVNSFQNNFLWSRYLFNSLIYILEVWYLY